MYMYLYNYELLDLNFITLLPFYMYICMCTVQEYMVLSVLFPLIYGPICVRKLRVQFNLWQLLCVEGQRFCYVLATHAESLINSVTQGIIRVQFNFWQYQ